MEWIVKELLGRADGREVILYGCGNMAEALRRMLVSTGCPVAFIVDRNYRYFHGFPCPVQAPDCLNTKNHFPVIVPFGINAIESIAANLRKLGYMDNDWFVWSRDVRDDFIFRDIRLGKRAQLSLAFVSYSAPRCIQSVGRYSSVNHFFQYGTDHDFQISTSPQLPITPTETQKEICRLRIGHDVWIGANAYVNCTKVKKIGNGAVIGAGAVVLEDVPPYAIVVGVPAKVKKFRFTQRQISILENVQWWNWSDKEIIANASCFYNTSLFFERFSQYAYF